MWETPANINVGSGGGGVDLAADLCCCLPHKATAEQTKNNKSDATYLYAYNDNLLL